MSDVSNSKKDTLEPNRTILKAVIQLCRLGGDFYNLIGQNVKHYEVKQVCFDMAKSYFQQISLLVEIGETHYQLPEEESLTSTSFEDYYQNVISKQVKLNPQDLVTHLVEIEEQHLAQLHNANSVAIDPLLTSALGNVLIEIQTTYKKLANLNLTIMATDAS